MKAFNKNSILFVFAALFVLLGFNLTFIRKIGSSVKDMFSAALKGNFVQLKKEISSFPSKDLSYQDYMLDINSLKDRLLGTRVVIKGDVKYSIADSGSLFEEFEELDEADIEATVQKVDSLKRIAESNGANFLYCAVPAKANYANAPENISNFSRSNYETFINKLAAYNLPYLDLSEMIEESGDPISMYYYTDHHWTARAGFNATEVICEKLSELYGFEYNKMYTDIINYNIENYPGYFLGSYGKKLGTYFTRRSPEDFELITPKFSTEITNDLPIHDSTATGRFEDVLLTLSNLKKDRYNVSLYSIYSGGDYHLQIMRNHAVPKGAKILIVRDSFAKPVQPFLVLQANEVHNCDMRSMEGMIGDKLNMEDYIREIDPDYVIVIYHTVLASNSERYNFF